jgi:site-specific recombinase XerD
MDENIPNFNTEEDFLNNIMLNLQDLDVSSEELTSIKMAIASEVRNYDISKKTYEVAVVDDYNDYVLQMFLATKQVEGRSERTLKHYHDIIKNFYKFLGYKPIKEITTNDIRFFLAKYQGRPGHENSNTTKDGMRRVLTSFFGWLYREEYLQHDPTVRISHIKNDTQKEDPYTTGEMEAMMLKAEHIRDKCILEFLYSTGCRVTELTLVELDDIDWEAKRVRLHGKGGKDRIVPINEKLLFYLKEYMNWRIEHDVKDPYFFVHKKSPYVQLHKCGVEDLVKNIGLAAGVEHPHPHRFRVTRITTLLKRGMKLEEVQVIAGHSNINTTANYNREDLNYVEAEFRRKG